MSEEAENMWDDENGPSRFGSRTHEPYYESPFASEQMDRAPLLSDEVYTDMSAPEQPDHCHWKPQAEPPSAVPQLVAALLLCAFFMVCEVIGGYLAGSLSVMCDAAHMLSDAGGFGLAILAIHLARRKRDHSMSYGYKRAEVLGAMVSVLLIWILTGGFLYLAVIRLKTRDFAIDPNTMIVVSSCGVFFNVIMAVVLHGFNCGRKIAHHHSHGGAPCTHAHTQPFTNSPEKISKLKFFKNGRQVKNSNNGSIVTGDYHMKEIGENNHSDHKGQKEVKNINLRAALVHVLGDLIQSCGVLLASILIKIYPEAKLVDPICTFIFSVLVFLTTVRVVRDALTILMEGVPRHFKYRELVAALNNIGGVRHVHSLHVWALSTHHIVMSTHVAVDELTDAGHVLRTCQNIAKLDFNIQSATIQIEKYTDAMLTCPECRSQPSARA